MTRTCNCGALLCARNRTGLCKICQAGRNRIQMPPNFAEIAAVKTNPEIMADFGVSKGTVLTWRKRVGVKAPRLGRNASNTIQVPADFALVAPTKRLRELCAIYRLSEPTIRRICRETGIDFYRSPPSEPRLRKQNKLLVMQNMGKRLVGAAMVAPTQRDMSLAGRAADFLQKRAAIFRCDASGQFQLGGTHWKWRGKAHAASEIVDAARELGFDPDAWQRLGAAA